MLQLELVLHELTTKDPFQNPTVIWFFVMHCRFESLSMSMPVGFNSVVTALCVPDKECQAVRSLPEFSWPYCPSVFFRDNQDSLQQEAGETYATLFIFLLVPHVFVLLWSFWSGLIGKKTDNYPWPTPRAALWVSCEELEHLLQQAIHFPVCALLDLNWHILGYVPGCLLQRLCYCMC